MSLTPQDKVALIQCINQHHPKIILHIGWKNFTKNLEMKNALVLDIQDIESLQVITKFIYKLNLTKAIDQRIILRPAAGNATDEHAQSYSFTNGAEADVIVRLQGDEFKQVCKTERENIFRVGGSLQIGVLDEILYNQYQSVLPVSSLIPYVTVSGLSANAGHGTGKDQPSFPGLIEAMTLCLPNGEIVRIDASHPLFETIRGAHLGLFGIVLDVELRCPPAKKLQCVTEARSVVEFLNELRNGLFSNDEYVSVMYIPTYRKNELTDTKHKNIIIYRWHPVDVTVNNVNTANLCNYFEQSIQIKLQQLLGLNHLLLAKPEITPYYMRYLVSRITVGDTDRLSVGPWPTVHYQTVYPDDINDISYLFPTSLLGENIEYAFTKLVTTLNQLAEQKIFPINYAVYLRVFQGTSGGLSSSEHKTGQYICGFDIVSSPSIPGYNAFRNEMNDFFIDKLAAKPHWGKYLAKDIDYKKIYGENYQQFKEALEAWYTEHHLELSQSMLLNSFFCNILQLPYAPQSILMQSKIKNDNFVSIKETAKQFSNLIKNENDLQGVLLKSKLMSVAGHPNFFPSKNDIPINEGNDQQKKRKGMNNY